MRAWLICIALAGCAAPPPTPEQNFQYWRCYEYFFHDCEEIEWNSW